MADRPMPKLDVGAAVAGLALSVMGAILGVFLGFPQIVGLIGAAAGGYAAGRMAGRDGVFHGAVVGALDVIALAIATSAGTAGAPNVVIDTVATLLGDALLLGLATMGGWLATRS
ncbi:MAG: hypothetical protein ACYC9W_08975, partial [Candidatus Limnocylindria bacterium]